MSVLMLCMLLKNSAHLKKRKLKAYTAANLNVLFRKYKPENQSLPFIPQAHYSK